MPPADARDRRTATPPDSAGKRHSEEAAHAPRHLATARVRARQARRPGQKSPAAQYQKAPARPERTVGAGIPARPERAAATSAPARPERATAAKEPAAPVAAGRSLTEMRNRHQKLPEEDGEPLPLPDWKAFVAAVAQAGKSAGTLPPEILETFRILGWEQGLLVIEIDNISVRRMLGSSKEKEALERAISHFALQDRPVGVEVRLSARLAGMAGYNPRKDRRLTAFREVFDAEFANVFEGTMPSSSAADLWSPALSKH